MAIDHRIGTCTEGPSTEQNGEMIHVTGMEEA